MNFFRKLTVLFLALVLSLSALALPVFATVTSTEHEGLEITVEMDKEQYEADESITATITVKNITKDEITIHSLEQLIPEGYRLAEDSDVSKGEVTLRPGRKLVLTVTMDSEYEPEEAEPTWWEVLLYGSTWGVRNILLLLIVIVLIVLFFILT